MTSCHSRVTHASTAWYLRQHSSADEIVLALKIGKIPVRFEQRDGLLFGEMRQTEPQFGAVHPHDVIAGVLGYRSLNGRAPAHPNRLHWHAVHHRPVPVAGHTAKVQHRLEPDAPYLGTIGNPPSSTLSAGRPSIPRRPYTRA